MKSQQQKIDQRFIYHCQIIQKLKRKIKKKDTLQIICFEIMYTNSYLQSRYNKTYSFTSYPTSSYTSNQYYKSKIYDDHRFERRKLQKPAFLIKQSAIYPQSSSYSISSALDYADNLVRPVSHKFYTQAAQDQRVRIQGKNPFLNQSSEQSLLNLGQSSRMKKSSRSRMGTNPNLGVTSYQVLQQTPLEETQYKKERQREIELSQIKKQPIEDYISQSLMQNFAEKPQRFKEKDYLIQQEQNEKIIRNSSGPKRQTFNPRKSTKKFTQSTIYKPKVNPEQLIYKGKRFVKLIN